MSTYKLPPLELLVSVATEAKRVSDAGDPSFTPEFYEHIKAFAPNVALALLERVRVAEAKVAQITTRLHELIDGETEDGTEVDADDVFDHLHALVRIAEQAGAA